MQVLNKGIFMAIPISIFYPTIVYQGLDVTEQPGMPKIQNSVCLNHVKMTVT